MGKHYLAMFSIQRLPSGSVFGIEVLAILKLNNINRQQECGLPIFHLAGVLEVWLLIPISRIIHCASSSND